MPDGTPQILDLDVLRASATKFKEKQAALEARVKNLDELETRLDAERISLGGRALAIESVRAALRRGPERLAQARLLLDQDASGVASDRLAIAEKQKRLQELVPLLEERDRLLHDAEDRLARRSDDLAVRIQKSEARLRILGEREKVVTERERELEERVMRLSAMGDAIGLREEKLIEREEEFIRRQNEITAALDTREKQVTVFCESMAAAAAEAIQRTESYAAMKAALEEELDRVAVARESTVAEEEWLREAQEILTATIGSGAESEGIQSFATPGLSLELPRVDLPASDPVVPETQTPAITLGSDEMAVPETTGSRMKEGAVGRLAEAIEAWERAREAGWNVSELRGHAKSAREAFVSGDYEGAIRSATTILTRLHASPAPL